MTFVSWLVTNVDFLKSYISQYHRANGLWISLPQLKEGRMKLVYLPTFVFN
jgi:hypothetical protein